MHWQRNLFEGHPEEFTWLHELATDFERLVPQKKWTELLNIIAMMHLDPPGMCRCREGWELVTWQHVNHAAFNTAVRTMIIDSGARKGLKKAIDREVAGPVTPDGTGPIMGREYAIRLRDFLSERPRLNWFRVTAYDPYHLYQGDALKNQHIAH